MPPSMICGSTGSCTSSLAAPAGPLAVDVAVHEELRRHDVQPLADVLADAHHRLAAVRRRAGGVLGLVVVLDAAQMVGQCLAPRAGGAGALARPASCGGAALQLLELRLQARPRPRPASPRTAPLLGAHRLGLGTELPGLQPRQLEGDLLELGVLNAQLGVLALESLLLCDLAACCAMRSSRRCSAAVARAAAQHPRGQRRDRLGAQALAGPGLQIASRRACDRNRAAPAMRASSVHPADCSRERVRDAHIARDDAHLLQALPRQARAPGRRTAPASAQRRGRSPRAARRSGPGSSAAPRTTRRTRRARAA